MKRPVFFEYQPECVDPSSCGLKPETSVPVSGLSTVYVTRELFVVLIVSLERDHAVFVCCLCANSDHIRKELRYTMEGTANRKKLDRDVCRDIKLGNVVLVDTIKNYVCTRVLGTTRSLSEWMTSLWFILRDDLCILIFLCSLLETRDIRTRICMEEISDWLYGRSLFVWTR